MSVIIFYFSENIDSFFYFFYCKMFSVEGGFC